MIQYPEAEHLKKVTAHIPTQLLNDAQCVTGQNITDTIRVALESLTREQAYLKLRGLRGTLPLSLDVTELRQDREYTTLGIDP